MPLPNIKQEIKALSRLEKLELIAEISKMLREEEKLLKHFTPGARYPVLTPGGGEKAAAQLQQFLAHQKR